MRKSVALLTATALGVSFLSAAPAGATPTVYTDSTAFTTATGSSTYDFPFPVPGVSLGTSYTLGPATFSSAGLVGYNDGGYGPLVPYLAATNSLSITTTAPAIGFFLGSYYSPQAVTYSVDGGVIGGSFAVPVRTDTAFLGFSGLSGPTTLSFTNNGELDTLSFLAPGAVPEPKTWAMMLVGFGMIGFAMRRRKRAQLRSAAT